MRIIGFDHAHEGEATVTRTPVPLWMIFTTLIVSIFGCTHSAVARQPRTEPINLFQLTNDKPLRAVVTDSTGMTFEDLTPLLEKNIPPMVRQLNGIIAVVEGRDLTQLLACAPRNVRRSIDRPSDAVRLYSLHIIGQRSSRALSVYTTSNGQWYLEEIVEGALTVMPRCVELNPARFPTVAQNWRGFTGGIDAETSSQIGVPFKMEPPYTPGWLYMDDKTLRARTFIAKPGERIGTARDLDNEVLRIRLPAGYDHKDPAGLLVWVHAGNNGSPPSVFNKTLDELNLICVGADNSGNERPVADRYQLALDGVATACKRYHVDTRRIYVTGISGGGRISSMLWATAPEVFTGAIPIVGINYFKAIPTGDGRKWPASYKKPPAKLHALMRKHRIAAMTGPPDFNYAPTVATIKLMRRDRFVAKLFEYPDMQHEMPTPDRFLEAIRWVDEPYQETRKREERESANWLERYQSNFGDTPVDGPEAEGLAWLLKAMETGPYTESAWQAWDLMGQEYPLNP